MVRIPEAEYQCACGLSYHVSDQLFLYEMAGNDRHDFVCEACLSDEEEERIGILEGEMISDLVEQGVPYDEAFERATAEYDSQVVTAAKLKSLTQVLNENANKIKNLIGAQK